MRPASGRNMPEIRLNAVVLPGAVRPMSACNVRSRTLKLALRTAWMPPKLLAIPSTSRIAPSSCCDGFRNAGSVTSPAWRCAIAASSTGCLRQRRVKALVQPDQPLGENTTNATKVRPK
jgi:hypothetical protein